MTRPLSAECRLVFRTADQRWTAGEIGALVRDVTDWERVAVIAERELATSQLARALMASGESVPKEFLDSARRRAQAIELRMQYFSRRLQLTCAALSSRDIPFMLLKGAALGAMVDPTFCSRPMNDGDILVRQQDANRAAEALEASGWSPSRDEVLRMLLVGAHHLPPFVDQQMPDMRLELHVSHLPAAHPFAFDTSVLWHDARPASEPFAGALVPSPEHLLLHAALHFAWQHPMTFGAWRTFRVISLVSAMPGFAWDRFVSGALAARAGTASYWTLRLGSRLAALDIADDVRQRLMPPTPAWVMDALERHFISAIAVGESPSSPSVRLNHLLWLAAIRPRWSGHATTRDWDHSNRWGQAYGAPAVSPWSVMAGHLRSFGRWSAFVTRTLASGARPPRRSRDSGQESA